MLARVEQRFSEICNGVRMPGRFNNSSLVGGVTYDAIGYRAATIGAGCRNAYDFFKENMSFSFEVLFICCSAK